MVKYGPEYSSFAGRAQPAFCFLLVHCNKTIVLLMIINAIVIFAYSSAGFSASSINIY